uniref:SEA domain-containing protein n=1 Tax=Elaeophora elaphi TaxID=1147741 RepID=A0A0R3RYG5_9BILA
MSRRLEGHFLVTEGPLLKFDGRLLQKDTDEFKTHANKIQRQLNFIYRQSDYGVAFVGSEVTKFRFVPAVPALDVTFILKTRSDLNIDLFNFLSILRSYVRACGFDGNAIDDKSISLEIKRF